MAEGVQVKHQDAVAQKEVVEHEADEWEEVVAVEEEEEEEEADPDAVWSSLDEALGEKGYDVYTIRTMLQSGQLPADLVALVAEKVSRRVERVRPMLEAQCPVLLPRVVALIATIERQLELQRLAQEAIERADAVEKVRLQELERIRQEEAIMERVQMIGRCCMGYEWCKAPGGYRCAGGSHFVPDSMVNSL